MTARRKIRLLFVIGNLVQGGSQRFTFELLKLLDRDRFDIEVLTRRRLSPRDYYAAEITELGIPVHRKLPVLLGHLWYQRRLFRRFRWPIELLHRLTARIVMGNLLERFDVINVVQIENYYLLQPLLADNERLLIYVMSQLFQYPFDPYADCRAGRRYRFTVFDRTVPAEWAEAPCRDAEVLYLPLSMDLSGRPDLSKHVVIEPPYRIGVFMRLSPERPISGIFAAFSRLTERVPAELWVYGHGDPRVFSEAMDAVGVRDRVVFKGHAQSLPDILEGDGLSFVWMTCYDATLGMASVELGSLGIPMLFWNLSEDTPDELAERTGGALRAYSDPARLAEATLEALRDPAAFRASGQRLREWIMGTYDLRHHLPALEEKLRSIAEANATPSQTR